MATQATPYNPKQTKPRRRGVFTAEQRTSAMKRRSGYHPKQIKGPFKREVIPAQGNKPAITFKRGALHAQLGVAQDAKIPRSKMAAARRGAYGALAKRRALFARNVLTGR